MLSSSSRSSVTVIMALCYLPCFGEARLLVRSGVSVPLSTGSNDKLSDFPCNTTSTWSINVKRYHSRRHHHGVPLPSQMNFKQATRTLHKSQTLIPKASVAQSNRPAFTSEERSSGSILTFSYSAPLVSREGEDADGGRAFGSSDDVDSRERLRRERIARANKGRVPWNKGRRHSPETIAKIKERTKVAMLNPKIRDKLRQYGKNQTVETKAKIREKMVGFWEGKRIIRETQDLCAREWKELIAEAARVGAPGEEEFEWDSYMKIKEQYKLEGLKAARQRKAALRATLKSERQRKPVSEAHRKAISDAIRAKWADPDYQARVSAGMAKADAEKRRQGPAMRTSEKRATPVKSSSTLDIVEVLVDKKKPSQAVPVDEGFVAEVLAEEVTLQTRRNRSTAARIKGPQKVTLVSLEDHNLSPGDDAEATGTKDRSSGQERVLWAAEGPLAEADVRAPTTAPGDVQLSSKLSSQSYKDPLVLEKVQRIQQLRQGRLMVELKRKEAADRARMLIANAERAANALEQAGNADAATLATLREARRVLAEATRSVQAAELKPGSSSNKSTPSGSSIPKEGGKAASVRRSGGFHDRLWTEGDSIENCPHPIPIRLGRLPSREEKPLPQMDEVSRIPRSSGSGSAEWVASQAMMAEDGEAEDQAEDQSPDSAGQPGEAGHGEGSRMAAAAEGFGREGGPRSAKSQGRSGSKKRWHRGRLVVMNDEERT